MVYSKLWHHSCNLRTEMMNLKHVTRSTCVALSASHITQTKPDSTGLLRLISTTFSSSPQAFADTSNLKRLHNVGYTLGSFDYRAAFTSVLCISKHTVEPEKVREKGNVERNR